MRLYWLSPFSLADGYGVAATAFVQMLTEADWDLNLHETWFCVRSELEKKIVTKLQMDSSRLVTERLGLALATPGTFGRLPTPIKVGYTMYESSNPEKRFPGWYQEMAVANALIVPAEFSAQVFARQFRGPIYIQPIPLLRRFMEAKVRPRLTGDIVKFGIHGTLTERKCPMETIKAFQQAFPSSVKDVRLEIKTRVVLDQSRQMPDLSDPRVKIINETWKPPRLLRWINTLDCHLFLSRGEGFGLPPRESLVTGCPIIISETSGLLDLVGHALVVPIKGQAQTHIGGVWDEPDFDAAIEQMRYVYLHRKEVSEQALGWAEWYREEYSWSVLAEKLRSSLSKIDKDFSVKPVPLHFGRGPADQREIGAVGNQLRQWIAPRSSILLAGFGSDELGAWFARRAFSVITVSQALERERKYKNLICSYGSKFELANIVAEGAVQAILFNIELDELKPGTIHDLLEQGFRVAKDVILLIPGEYENRYAVLFEGLDNVVVSLGNWQLVRLAKSDSASRGLLIRNLAAARLIKLGRKKPAQLVRSIDGVKVRR